MAEGTNVMIIRKLYITLPPSCFTDFLIYEGEDETKIKLTEILAGKLYNDPVCELEMKFSLLQVIYYN